MFDANTLRAAIARAYARAAARLEEGAAEMDAHTGGIVARSPGYTWTEVARLPIEARVSSFGCGNPLAFAVLREGEVVLDLGSGAGVDLLLAASRVGPTGRVIGVDMTRPMVRRAQATATSAGFQTVQACQALMEQLPIASSSVDCVVSNGAISLSPEKDRVFRETFRVLKPGGRTVVSDIAVRRLPSWFRESPALAASCVAGALSEEGFRAALQEAGFEDVDVRERLAYEPPEIAAVLEAELSAYRAGLREAGLAEKELRERVASEPSPVAALLEESLPGSATEDRTQGDRQREALLEAGHSLFGAIWSVTFFARKSPPPGDAAP